MLVLGSVHMLIGMWLLGATDMRVAALRTELDARPRWCARAN